MEQAKEIAANVADIVAKDPNNYNIGMDWGEKSKVLHLELDQDKLRSLGISTEAVSKTIYTEVTGAKAAEFYTGDRTIDIDLRLAAVDRTNLAELKELPIYLGRRAMCRSGRSPRFPTMRKKDSSSGATSCRR